MEENLVSIFMRQVSERGRRTALMRKAGGTYVDITWDEFGQAVQSLAGALVGMGVRKGDRVAVFGYNSPEWAYTDLAALMAGAQVVPIYFKSAPPQVQYILSDSGAVVVMAGGPDQLAAVLGVRDSLPELRHVIAAGDAGRVGAAGVIRFDEALAKGAGKDLHAEVARRREGIGGDDVATIVYTSGTTGEPKGVMLTHRGIISNARCGMEVVGIKDGDVGLSFLPTSHVLDRVVVHYMNVVAGGTLAYAESLETVLADVQAVKPTAMCGVPRMFEKIYAGIHDKVNAGLPLGKRIFRWAEETGRKTVLCRMGYRTPGVLQRLRHHAADRLVFGKIRGLFGGRMRVFASGGAHLREDIDIFFRAIGIPIMHGYGLTEATCTVTLNTMDDFMPGTLGRPYPGVEVAIAEDGEILVKGDIVMKGYYKKPRDSTEVLENGWLRTGDLGVIDAGGYLVMNDRKKDILVTSGGKNISPQRIETLLKLNRLVEQAAVIAEGRHFVSVLIVPAFAELANHCRQAGIAYASPVDAVETAGVKALFQGIVDEVNRELDGFERVKKFSLLPREFTAEADELTFTLKVKRRVIDDRYRRVIDAMYE